MPKKKTEFLWLSSKRERTYKRTWPFKGDSLCNPQNMARNGFYSVATRQDQTLVKCVACHTELGGWEKEDDPWEEHLKRGDRCAIVQMKLKGQTQLCLKDVLFLFKESIKNKILHQSGTAVNSLRKKEEATRVKLPQHLSSR